MALAGALVLMSGAAQAAVWNVRQDNTGDFTSIQAAIDAASPGDAISIGPGTYYENLVWNNKDLVIQGAGRDHTTINGNASGQGFGGVCLTTSGLSAASRLEGVTLTNGTSLTHLNDNGEAVFDLLGGGMRNSGSSPTIAHCAFAYNDSRGGYYIDRGSWDPYYPGTQISGGGMENADSSNPTVTDCLFIGNLANFGGGMDNTSSSPTVTDCTFIYNAAENGGAIHNFAASPVITRCTFINGFAGGGAGIYAVASSNVTLTDCTISGNSATVGSGIYCSGSLAMTGCTISDNKATYWNGGVYSDGVLTATNCTFRGNTAAAFAGGIGAFGSTTITNCTFRGNLLFGDGYNYPRGGGIYAEGNPIVTNCAFIDNVAGSDISNLNGLGGGMFTAGNPTVTNCTFAGNGAFYGYEGYSGNGGGMFTAGNPTVTNSLFWGNWAYQFYANQDSVAGMVTYGTPAVNNSDVQDLSNATPDANGNFAANPLFVDAANGDLHLRWGSPCIDTGLRAAIDATGVATDLDGKPRVSRATVDVGAHEYQNNAPDLSAPDAAAVQVGSTVHFHASATDAEGDGITFGLVNPPSWATIDGNGLVTLSPLAGAGGIYTMTVRATDSYGVSSEKNVSVTVCPVVIEKVMLSRNKYGEVTVQLNVRNTSQTVAVNNVSLNSSTLAGTATKTALPILYPQLKPGMVKTVQLKYQNVQKGPATFIVNGTSSLGPFNVTTSVTVP